MSRVSVYIIAYNEAEKVRATVESALWADEVIVVDSWSTDGTAEIAASLGARVVQVLSVSQVRFAHISAADIETYVASGEPMGKAGAYAVQGLAAAYIARISGSYSGIMGLPLHETAQALRQFG